MFYICAILTFFFIVLPLKSHAVSQTPKKTEPIKIDAAVSDELSYILTFIRPSNDKSENRLKDNKPDKTVFDPGAVEKLINFVISDKKNGLYYADKKKFYGAESAYYEFDVNDSLEHLLHLTYNPDIPAALTAPSSIHMSRWLETDGLKKPIPKMWQYLADLDKPVVVRGKETVTNTPDQSSGGYYSYDLHRTLILFKHKKNNNVFISLSSQTDVSDVGKRGYVLGSDDDWNYLYSGKKGLTKTGIQWVRSYMYDSTLISVFYEKESGPARWGIFKWLRAGWMNANVVRKHHIYKGIERYARTVKKIVEHPLLPEVPEVANFICLWKFP